MEGGQGRKFLAGVGAWVLLVAASSGCQSLAFPRLMPQPAPQDPTAHAAISPPPILLGPPVTAARADGPGSTSSQWHAAASDDRLVGSPQAAGHWHVANHVSGRAGGVLVATSRPTAAPPDPTLLIPARMQAAPTSAEPPVKIEAPPGANLLPAPRPLPTVPQSPPGVLVADHGGPPDGGVPRELAKVALPAYVIQPPDILLIQARLSPLPEQSINGQHLVRPDGSVSLGIYGSAYVAGMTLEQARDAVAAAVNASPILATRDRLKPYDISVDVLAYNSRVYYVITDGGGYGEQVYKFPVTGNETVLDAISNITGLPAVASKKHIWVARAVPGHGSYQNILPVDWIGLTQGGGAATNYQLFPGDRVYVQSDKLIRIDSALAKFLAPIERVLGVTLLGSETVNSIRNGGRNSNNTGF
jgi:polysaccharide export outer membrane protein